MSGHPTIKDSDYPGELQILPDALRFSLPARQQNRRSAITDHPSESVTASIEQLERIEVVKGFMFWVWINVHMKDGTCSSLQFGGSGSAAEAARLIRLQIDGR